MLKDTVWAKYIKEREDLDILEDEFGFITYKFNTHECFIQDMCVDTSKRSQSHGRGLIDQLVEIAKAHGCTYIGANIFLADKGAMNTLTASMRVGFKIAKANNDVLFIVKDIGG
jgi:hypothetical protein